MGRDWTGFSLKPDLVKCQELFDRLNRQIELQPFILEGQLIKGVGKMKADAYSEFVNDGIKDFIAGVCQANNYTISIRKAGKDTIDRLEDGAHPKPHTILDKSMKRKTLSEELYNRLKGLNKQKRGSIELFDITGLVGKMGKNGFTGIYATGMSGHVAVLQADEMFTIGSQKYSASAAGEHLHSYIDFGLLMGGKAQSCVLSTLNCEEIVTKLAVIPGFVSCCYTGDYDLHEAYINLKETPEAMEQKRELLMKLNNTTNDSAVKIESLSPKQQEFRLARIDYHIRLLQTDTAYDNRQVIEKLESLKNILGRLSPEHISVKDNMFLFQHGDQATYMMSSYLEMVEAVPSVASEEPDELLWCHRGLWLKTGQSLDGLIDKVLIEKTKENLRKHDILRSVIGITKPSKWL